MAGELHPISEHHHVVTKLQRKVAGSISRRSRHRRNKKITKINSDSSIHSGITVSSRSGSVDFFSDDGGSLEDDGFSITEHDDYFNQETPYPLGSSSANYGPVVESGDIPLRKMTINVPVRYYGDYRTISQNDFFMECMINCDGNAIVHFFDENNPTSIELDAMLGMAARKYTSCKFLRIDGTTTDFLCKKLRIESFPTVLAIQDKFVLDLLSDFHDTFSQRDIEKWILNAMPSLVTDGL